MKENVGKVDRLARWVVGPALMALGYARWGGNRGEWGGLGAMLSGTLLLESAVTRVCPMNAVLGIDTRRPEQIREDLRRSQIYHREKLGDDELGDGRSLGGARWWEFPRSMR